MNAKTIIDAILALDAARQALRCGDASIVRQMQIGNACCDAAARLQAELARDVPNVQIKAAA